jgi:hypothetical protein
MSGTVYIGLAVVCRDTMNTAAALFDGVQVRDEDDGNPSVKQKDETDVVRSSRPQPAHAGWRPTS